MLVGNRQVKLLKLKPENSTDGPVILRNFAGDLYYMKALTYHQRLPVPHISLNKKGGIPIIALGT
jgi:hypothetical protein